MNLRLDADFPISSIDLTIAYRIHVALFQSEPKVFSNGHSDRKYKYSGAWKKELLDNEKMMKESTRASFTPAEWHESSEVIQFSQSPIANSDSITAFPIVKSKDIDLILHELPKNYSFISIYDMEFNHWQTEATVQNYVKAGRPYEHLPKMRGAGIHLEVDVSKNPGHGFLLPGFYYKTAWRKYFGAQALMFFPKERLLQLGNRLTAAAWGFKDGSRVEELPNGSVMIELFENPDEPELPKNIDRMWLFRQWMKVDKLQADAQRLCDMHNPRKPIPPEEMMIVILETQDCKHGGYRGMIAYYGADKHPAMKKDAVYRVWQEWSKENFQLFLVEQERGKDWDGS
jgi:hypothetical protein